MVLKTGINTLNDVGDFLSLLGLNNGAQHYKIPALLVCANLLGTSLPQSANYRNHRNTLTAHNRPHF